MRKRALCYLTLLLLGFVAVGCGDTDTTSQPIPQTLPTPFPGFTFPLLDLANGVIPLPNNFLLDPQTGLLNLPGETPGPEDSTVNAANTLDGFSTLGPIVIPFRGTVVPSTVNTQTLPVYNSVTGQPALVTYSVTSAAAGSVVTVTPVLPLKPGTTYVVVLTQGIISALSNTPILSDNAIKFLQQPTPLVDGNGNSITLGLDNATAQRLEPVRLANQAVIGAAETLTGTNRSSIPFAFAFTTQTLFEALPAARAQVIAANAGLKNSLPGIPLATGNGPGNGDALPPFTIDEFWSTLPAAVQAAPNTAIGAIYSGTIAVPQFRANPFEDYWAQPPVAGASINVPYLLFLPKTATPDPVVIFQHGITRSKNDALILANAFNSQGIALIAIDLPLHGDLRPDKTLPDGTGFINPAKPRVTRSNIFQGVVGQYALNNAIFSGQSDLNGDAVPELVPGSIAPPFFLGQSLGSITGILFGTTDPNTNRAVYNVPGGRLVNLLVTSPAFGPPVLEGLAAKGIVPGTAEFAKFVIFTQAVLDDADPSNYAIHAVNGSLRGGKGVDFLQQLHTEDLVIDPPVQYDLANAFGQDTAYRQVDALLRLDLVAQAISPTAGPGLFEIPGADHGAILNPALGPTVQIVTQALTFIGKGQIIAAGLRAQAVSERQAEDLVPYAKTISF